MKRRATGHLADLALGLGLTALLFGLGELLLWALGLAAPPASVDISRGFDASAAYIVPDPLVAGGWTTQFTETKLQEVLVPPRPPAESGRPKRVLLFGGSNTDGFPDSNLQLMLNGAAGTGDWEVINLGRSGYGSGRVSIVFEQAVAKLDPDVVVLYTGHNEFVEQSFQQDLEGQWSSPLGRRVARMAAASRVVTGVRRWLGEPAAAPKRPRAWKWEYDKFKGLTYPATLAVYERYGQNLALMCRTALDQGVGVVLCTVVHNHFAVPFESTLPPGWEPAQVAQFEQLRARIAESFPEWLRPVAPLDVQERVIHGDWRAPKEKRRKPPLPAVDLGSRACFGELANAPAKRTARKKWSEKTWRLLEALETLKTPVQGAQRAQLEQLEETLLTALDSCSDHPLTHFELALVRLALGGEAADIAPHFEDAARFDRAPRRGNGATNDIVRRVASEHDGVVLVDAEEIFRARMPMGLVGWEWMSDHCHLNPGAALVFMADLAQVLQGHWP